MNLQKIKKGISALGNLDIDFFYHLLENLESRNDIEVVFSGTLANGKSTLINAILKKNLLPAKMGVTTSMIAVISKGDDRVVALKKDGDKDEYPLSSESIEEISKNDEVQSLVVYMSDFPYSGIAFVDTPGIDDISMFREEKTIDYVPLADAVVFVLDASKGMTAEEKKFFEERVMKANKDKIFIVLNKADTLNEESNIEKLVPESITSDYRIYAVSALKYLAGTLSGDEKKLNESKLSSFLTDLNSYINSLDSKKVLDSRKIKTLHSIRELADSQYDMLVESVSKTAPQIQEELESLDRKMLELKKEKERLEEEIDKASSSVEECAIKNLSTFRDSVERNLQQVQAKEFKIDVFNEKIPVLCEELRVQLKECSENAFGDFSFEMQYIDELHLKILRDIDDIMAQLAWILTLLPKVGEKVKPLIPAIQEGVRRLVDIFGGQIIDGAVDSRLEKLMDSIEISVVESLNDYKKSILDEYEHSRLGTVRSEIIALESSLRSRQEKRGNVEYQIEYYQNGKKELDELLMQEADRLR